jgi:carboxylate-amine ligase
VARWRAARHGATETLVHPGTGTLRPAHEVVGALLELLRPDLEGHGEWDEVAARVALVMAEGGAASRYRHLMERTGDLRQVAAAAVAETAGEAVCGRD